MSILEESGYGLYPYKPLSCRLGLFLCLYAFRTSRTTLMGLRDASLGNWKLASIVNMPLYILNVINRYFSDVLPQHMEKWSEPCLENMECWVKNFLSQTRERERESQLIGIDSCSSISFESHFSQKLRSRDSDWGRLFGCACERNNCNYVTYYLTKGNLCDYVPSPHSWQNRDNF